MFKKIGLALAFSPTCRTLLLEAVRLRKKLEAELILIHIGEHDAESLGKMDELVQLAGLVPGSYRVIWRAGKPASAILSICKAEKIDLLIAGAIRHESLLNYYVGSIALKILRHAPCSLLILVEPMATGVQFNEIAIEAEVLSSDSTVMEAGVDIARRYGARHVYFLREAKLFTLGMSVISDSSTSDVSTVRKDIIRQEMKRVEERLEQLDLHDIPYSIKILAGKSGYELRKYTRQIKADLLVLGAVRKKLYFIDRLFTNNLEFIFEDIPCNLLILKTKT